MQSTSEQALMSHVLCQGGLELAEVIASVDQKHCEVGIPTPLPTNVTDDHFPTQLSSTLKNTLQNTSINAAYYGSAATNKYHCNLVTIHIII